VFLWEENVRFFGQKLHLQNCTLKMRIYVQISTQNSTFCFTKTRFYKKKKAMRQDKKTTYKPLFSDSAYFSEAKTTFGVFGMICFG
jgi:hypothetical protein